MKKRRPKKKNRLKNNKNLEFLKKNLNKTVGLTG
jgi:hypothetical protein